MGGGDFVVLTVAPNARDPHLTRGIFPASSFLNFSATGYRNPRDLFHALYCARSSGLSGDSAYRRSIPSRASTANRVNMAFSDGCWRRNPSIVEGGANAFRHFPRRVLAATTGGPGNTRIACRLRPMTSVRQIIRAANFSPSALELSPPHV